MAALARGKHVLCEKPLALTAAQAHEMRDAAANSNVAIALQLQLRWVPVHMLTRQIIASGDLGEPIHMIANFDNPITQGTGPLELPEWWLEAETGGGWLRNLNAHGIDLIRYFLGDFAAVSGVVHTDPARHMSADDSYSVAFVLKNGMQGTMAGTCRSWDAHSDIRLHFAEGLAKLNVHDPSVLTLSDAQGTRRIEPPADTLADFRPVREVDPPPAGPLPGAAGGAYEAAHEVPSCTPSRSRCAPPSPDASPIRLIVTPRSPISPTASPRSR
jgi:predicted dehydrogenase